MAIEKNYFSTYGWEIDDAYYKIRDDYTKEDELNDDSKTYNYVFEVFRNKDSRDAGQDPISSSRFTIEVDKSKFDKKLSDKDNFLTAGYVYLKNLTNSFKNEGKDV